MRLGKFDSFPSVNTLAPYEFQLRDGKGAAKIAKKRTEPGCQWARRGNYHIAQIRQLLSDQEYLHCAKESEEGQTVLTRRTSGLPLWVEVLRCKKSKEWRNGNSFGVQGELKAHQ